MEEVKITITTDIERNRIKKNRESSLKLTNDRINKGVD